MRIILGTPIRHVVCVFLLPSLLLTSCQSPKVTVVVNRLQPGMLKDKTVGVEGLNITSAYWPGKFIEEPILDQTEKALQHRLKDAHFCLLNEDGTIHEGLEWENVAPAIAKTPVKEPDYIFRILLRADSIDHSVVKQSLVGTGRLYSTRGGGGGSSGWPMERWRVINKRVLTADYILSDSRTHQLIWRARAESSKLFFDANYRSMSEVEAEVPLNPLWVSMNSAVVRTIKK